MARSPKGDVLIVRGEAEAVGALMNDRGLSLRDDVAFSGGRTVCSTAIRGWRT